MDDITFPTGLARRIDSTGFEAYAWERFWDHIRSGVGFFDDCHIYFEEFDEVGIKTYPYDVTENGKTTREIDGITVVSFVLYKISNEEYDDFIANHANGWCEDGMLIRSEKPFKSNKTSEVCFDVEKVRGYPAVAWFIHV